MSDPANYQELKECYNILQKIARRCARDLRHAIDNMYDPELQDLFRERFQHYELVLGNTTDYRLELLKTIVNLENNLASIKAENVRLVDKIRETDPDQKYSEESWINP